MLQSSHVTIFSCYNLLMLHKPSLIFGICTFFLIERTLHSTSICRVLFIHISDSCDHVAGCDLSPAPVACKGAPHRLRDCIFDVHTCNSSTQQPGEQARSTLLTTLISLLRSQHPSFLPSLDVYYSCIFLPPFNTVII
jgi:hypothetical protein